MKLNIKILDENVREFYEHHHHYHESDAGLDLFIPETIIISAHSTQRINLQIACEAFDDVSHCPISFYVYPRSSISTTPLRLSNSVGIIDSGYRGPILCSLDNTGDTDYLLQRGTRLVQICSPYLGSITFQLKDELRTSSRGTGGFGSTGTGI